MAVDVYPGNTGDPTTVPDQAEKLRQRFGLSRVVLVGDRGMLTQAQIGKLKQHPGLGWISALREPAIRELVESGSLQLSLFDEENLAEIRSPAHPGERLAACFNPLLGPTGQPAPVLDPIERGVDGNGSADKLIPYQADPFLAPFYYNGRIT